MKNILCYGDSNTWGFIPGTGERLEKDRRWTGVVQNRLGSGYRIIEDGINGRTSAWDHRYWGEYVNGLKGLPYALFREKPIDMAVVMLGTNDLLYTDAEGVYKGMYILVRNLVNAQSVYEGATLGSRGIFASSPSVLLVAPVCSADSTKDDPDGGFRYRESRKIAARLKEIADHFSIEFLDASEYAEASSIDGIHMDAENHAKLGEAISDKLRRIL